MVGKFQEIEVDFSYLIVIRVIEMVVKLQRNLS